MRETTDGFLWSQKGKTTSEHESKTNCDEKNHIPGLKWEDSGSFEVPWCTLGLHVAYA